MFKGSHLCLSHALCDHLSDVCQVMYSSTVTVQCTVARWLLGPRRGESRKYSWMSPPPLPSHHGTHVITSPGAIHIESYHSMGVFALTAVL